MRGRDAKTYYDSASNWTTPTLVEIAKVIDETITPEAELVAGGSREEEYEDNVVVSRKFSLNMTYRYKKASVGTDTVFAALQAAFIAGTPLYMYFLDGSKDVNGSKGWRAPIMLSQAPIKRDHKAIVEVTFQGTSCLVDLSGSIAKPAAYTVSSAVPTTTTTAAPTTTTTT